MSLLMFMLLLPSGSSLGCRETSTDSVLPPPSRPRQRNPSSSVRPSRTWSRRSTHEHLAASLTPKLSYTQMIDFNRWAGDWNGEVAKQERDVIAGRLEPVQDPANQINRKAPFDLSHWWTESKKDVNTARTIENNKRQLQAMRERKRIQVEAPATESSAAVGVTCNGVRFSFPFVNNSSATTPRAAPSLAPVDEAPNEQEDVGEDSYMDAGGENGGGVGQGGGVDDGRSSSVASGTAGGVASGGASSAREGTGRVREGDGAYVVPAAACSTLQSVHSSDVWHRFEVRVRSTGVESPAAGAGPSAEKAGEVVSNLWTHPSQASVDKASHWWWWWRWCEGLLGARKSSSSTGQPTRTKESLQQSLRLQRLYIEVVCFLYFLS